MSVVDGGAASVPLVIAIDGPAASGKSSTAKWVAEELGIHHADSGALYRAATLARLRRDDDDPATWTEQSVLDAAEIVSLSRGKTDFEVCVSGAVASIADLHAAEVTAQVSRVAQMPRVRVWVNERMYRCAREGPIVVDGRDIGTAVFPEAPVKVFLVADARERARRRLVQRLKRAPRDEDIAPEAAAIEARDQRDAAQTRPASDAVIVDTTHLTPQEQVRRIVALVQAAAGNPTRALLGER